MQTVRWGGQKAGSFDDNTRATVHMDMRAPVRPMAPSTAGTFKWGAERWRRSCGGAPSRLQAVVPPWRLRKPMQFHIKLRHRRPLQPTPLRA